MEHIPNVTNPYNPLNIPYLGGSKYDGLDFAGYPMRQNWDTGRLRQGNLQGRTQLEAAQFLQTWLYFGMLYEAVKLDGTNTEPINLDEFVRTDESTEQKFVSTKQLPGVLNSLITQLRKYHQVPVDSTAPSGKTRADAPNYYSRFRTCMILSCGVWRDLMQSSSGSDTTPLLSHEILLSIQILGAALDIGITEVCGSSLDYTWRNVLRSTWLENRMIQHGWCPNIVAQLRKPCATFLYYCSLLGPPRPEDDHSRCLIEEEFCSASNVDNESKITPKHVKEGCKCEEVIVNTGDGSKIAHAIEKGEIPVLGIKEDGEILEIEVHNSESPIPYIAISHVWADGLGDSQGNTIPRCQLRRISQLLADLPIHSQDAEQYNLVPHRPATTSPQTHYFWLDTLCVPANDPTLRQQAILTMRDVYANASKVLVLDAELLRHHAEDSTYYEVFTRITCSNWIRRLWTLQEATLNHNLLFQFSNRAVYVGVSSRMAQMQSHDNESQPWNLVAWECNRYSFDWVLCEEYHDTATRMNIIWHATQNRTTSRTGDEPLCIGILLGLDTAELQKEPGACTVEKFWSLHEKIGVPAAMLFYPGKKLDVEGLGWAPKFLKSLTATGSNIKAFANVTPQGLQATYSGFCLGMIDREVRMVIPVVVEGELFFIRENLNAGMPSWEGLKLHERKGLSLIICPISTEEGKNTAGGLVAGLGALVEWVSQEGEPINQVRYVRYLRYVSVVKVNSFYDLQPMRPWSEVELEEKLQPPIEGKYIMGNQMWCIG